VDWFEQVEWTEEGNSSWRGILTYKGFPISLRLCLLFVRRESAPYAQREKDQGIMQYLQAQIKSFGPDSPQSRPLIEQLEELKGKYFHQAAFYRWSGGHSIIEPMRKQASKEDGSLTALTDLFREEITEYLESTMERHDEILAGREAALKGFVEELNAIQRKYNVSLWADGDGAAGSMMTTFSPWSSPSGYCLGKTMFDTPNTFLLEEV
jgi:hypothetical protein